MKNNKLLMTLIVFISVFALVGPTRANAVTACTYNQITNLKTNMALPDDNVSKQSFIQNGGLRAALTCTCLSDSPSWKGKSISTCTNAQKNARNYDQDDVFAANHVGASYNIMNADTRAQGRYNYGMQSLWGLIKSIINVFIGVLLFILGFGFLWNLMQMGIHSSNPQARQQAISRIGEVFATAIFVGLIPLVFQFVTGLIAGLA